MRALVVGRPGAARLETLSPLNVLGRGYSLTRKENQEIVRDASQVCPGERLETLVHKGRIISRVEETIPEENIRLTAP